MTEDLEIQPGVVIPASDLSWSASRASGSGGQHVNKTATKVELRFDLAATRALSPAVKARLRKLAGNRFDAEGRLLIESQSSRSQAHNRDDARERLRQLVARALIPPKRRRPTKPSRGAKRRRLQEKRQQSEKKKNRRPPSRDD